MKNYRVTLQPDITKRKKERKERGKRESEREREKERERCAGNISSVSVEIVFNIWSVVQMMTTVIYRSPHNTDHLIPIIS